MKKSLELLETVNYSEGESELREHKWLLKRIITRIYPEKDAEELKNDLVLRSFIASNSRMPVDLQSFFVGDIKRAIRVINRILREYELCGFDDNVPMSGKLETNVELKDGSLSVSNKRTMEK